RGRRARSARRVGARPEQAYGGVLHASEAARLVRTREILASKSLPDSRRRRRPAAPRRRRSQGIGKPMTEDRFLIEGLRIRLRDDRDRSDLLELFNEERFLH